MTHKSRVCKDTESPAGWYDALSDIRRVSWCLSFAGKMFAVMVVYSRKQLWFAPPHSASKQLVPPDRNCSLGQFRLHGKHIESWVSTANHTSNCGFSPLGFGNSARQQKSWERDFGQRFIKGSALEKRPFSLGWRTVRRSLTSDQTPWICRSRFGLSLIDWERVIRNCERECPVISSVCCLRCDHCNWQQKPLFPLIVRFWLWCTRAL